MTCVKQIILVRKDLKLTRGKMSAQVSHASLEAYLKAKKKVAGKAREWEREGSKKVVVYVADEQELMELFKKIPPEVPKALIHDAGHTHLPPGTTTCLGLGPYDDELLDRYTGHLKLVD